MATPLTTSLLQNTRSDDDLQGHTNQRGWTPISMTGLDAVVQEVNASDAENELLVEDLPHEEYGFFHPGRDFESSNVSHKFTQEELERMKTFEGLDYYKEENTVYKRHIATDKEPASYISKWVMFFVIGTSVGIVAFLLFQSIAFIAKKRKEATLSAIDPHKDATFWEAYFFHVGTGTACAFFSTLLVVFIAPAAAGSGVPDVMGYLNGVLVPSVFNVKTLLVKFSSCVLAVGSGLPVGPEGPIIHIGALLGAGLPTGRSRTLGVACENTRLNYWFQKFREPKEHRDFITGGAAAGVSAAFSAPVGGLLFVFEEVASFWEPRLTWMVFFACLMSSFANSFFASSFEAWEFEGGFGYFADKMDVIFPLQADGYRFHILTMIPTLALGLIGGALGGIFTFINLKVVRMRLRRIAGSKLLRVLEVCLVTFSYLTITFGIAVLTDDCKDIPEHLMCAEEHEGNFTMPPEVGYDDSFFIRSTSEVEEQPACEWIVHQVCEQIEGRPEPNRFSPAATLVLSSGEEVVKLLLTSPKLGFDIGALHLGGFLLLYFMFSCWSAGMSISSGLVIPMLITGATMGRLSGVLIEYIAEAHWNDPSIFALLGAAAFFAGVSRLTISLAVIMLEISGAVHFLLPIMATVLVAKWVADFATHSLYHALLEVKCVPFLDFLCDIKKMDCFQARDIMVTPVKVVKSQEKVGDLVRMLANCTHNGFPVVDDSPEGNNVFKGVILRSQLCALLNLAVTGEAPGSPGSPVQSHDWKEFEASKDSMFFKRCGIPNPSREARDQYLDLVPHVNTSSFSVSEFFTVNIVRNLFRTMALRHLPVVNSHNQVVGMITRKNLIGHAIEKGMSEAIEVAQ